MNAIDRSKRDQEIVELFRAGSRPSAIAMLFDIEAAQVRRVIHAAGLEIEREDGYANGWSLWEMTERDRRIAIWERQREGARQALEA